MDGFDISGKHAVVIGMGGIGREIALGLTDHGADVAARFATGQILYVDGGLTASV